jgi:hypothetical protein
MKKICRIKGRGSFTLLELILVIAVASTIAIYAIKSLNHANFLSGVDDLQDAVVEIVQNGIISTDGYINPNPDCSGDIFSLYELTAYKLQSCMNYSEFELEDNTTQNNSSAFIGKRLMRDYGGCRILLSNHISDISQFNMFVDCSEVDFNSKSFELIEDSLVYTFEERLKYTHVQTYKKAKDISTNYAIALNSGTLDDGMIGVVFKLR